MTHVKFNHRPFERSFNNLVDDLFTELPVLFKNEGNPGWNGLKNSTPVNISEGEKSYVVDVIAPGFEKSDFKVNVEQNILTVSAEKKDEVKKEGDKALRSEYKFRSFSRSFTLDEKIDGAGIEAKYVNGVLTLNLPKKAEVKVAAQAINIQ